MVDEQMAENGRSQVGPRVPPPPPPPPPQRVPPPAPDSSRGDVDAPRPAEPRRRRLIGRRGSIPVHVLNGTGTTANGNGNGHAPTAREAVVATIVLEPVASEPISAGEPSGTPALEPAVDGPSQDAPAPVWEPSFPSDETLDAVPEVDVGPAPVTVGSDEAGPDHDTADAPAVGPPRKGGRTRRRPRTARRARRSEKRSERSARRATAREAKAGRPLLRRIMKIVAIVAILGVLGTTAAAGVMEYRKLTRTNDGLESALADARAAAASAAASAAADNEALTEQTSDLRAEIADLNGELREAVAAKQKTKIKEVTVRVEVPKWVPNGKGIDVDTAGFDGQIEIHDVQLTHSFGYSDFVGIAINKTGRTVSYAQIGCTFLDAKGRVLANAIHNRNNWAPGASWGFDCSAEVNATGGIVRVDEMS